MVVISIIDCPLVLRGDLSKWMLEINTGIFVGRMSARVRDELWKRICDNIKTGRATMVFNANNEQGMDFKIHNTTWLPVDYDGIKLIKHLFPKTEIQNDSTKNFVSKNSKRKQIARINAHNKQKILSDVSSYCVLSFLTTGQNYKTDCVVEIAALKIDHGLISENCHYIIKCDDNLINEEFIKKTGINIELKNRDGVLSKVALKNIFYFIGDLPILVYNFSQMQVFLLSECKRVGIESFKNKVTDLKVESKRSIDELESFELDDIINYFNLEKPNKLRALDFCKLIFTAYSKLMSVKVVDK